MRGRVLCILFLLIPIFFHGEERKTVCLNMIVKNDAKIIRKSLESVKNVIDYWVIFDLGSHDGTQDEIFACMENIPGQIVQYSMDVLDWGAIRSEAFQLAACCSDYVLFLNPDDVLVLDDGVQKLDFTGDCYFLPKYSGQQFVRLPMIVRSALPWRWEGIVYEYLACDVSYSPSLLAGVSFRTFNNRSLILSAEEAVRILEDALRKDRSNARYVFYLAECYQTLGDTLKALQWYQKRSQMEGWAEEIYWSKLQIAHFLKGLGLSPNIVLDAYENAYQFRPSRLEAVFYLAAFCNSVGRFSESYEILSMRWNKNQMVCEDFLYVEDWIGRYGLLFELSLAASYTGHNEEALQAADQILDMDNVPSNFYWRTELNREFFYNALNPH